jgi:hypothetical protein
MSACFIPQVVKQISTKFIITGDIKIVQQILFHTSTTMSTLNKDKIKFYHLSKEFGH